MKFINEKKTWLEINEIDNSNLSSLTLSKSHFLTTKKIKEKMIKNNQFFKIKKGKDMGIVLDKDYFCEGDNVVFMEIPEEKTYHPDWLINVEKTTTQDGSELSFYFFLSDMKGVDHLFMWGNTVEVCGGVK